jgi:Domain of unknown function (DUF1735)
MKKILYLAIFALGLQSCLKDKEHESDVFNSVGLGTTVIEYAAPNRMSSVDVLDAKVGALPELSLGLKVADQVFRIPVELATGKIDNNIDVTATVDLAKLPAYNVRRVADYNAAKAVYNIDKAKYESDLAAYNAAVAAGAIQLPNLPIAPALIPDYVPFILLPTVSYTLSNAVIPKGSLRGEIVLTVKNANVNLVLGGNYMLPITLSANSGVRISNPTTLFKLGVAASYTGNFRYTGMFQRQASSPSDPYTALVPQNTVLNILKNSDGVIEMPVAGVGVGVGQIFRMKVEFDGITVRILTPSQAGSLTAQVSQLPSSNPTLVFNADGDLDEIKDFHYTYLGGANGDLGRRFFMTSIKRVP